MAASTTDTPTTLTTSLKNKQVMDMVIHVHVWYTQCHKATLVKIVAYMHVLYAFMHSLTLCDATNLFLETASSVGTDF